MSEQSLSLHNATVTDGVSKLGNTSVIFLDLGVRVDITVFAILVKI